MWTDGMILTGKNRVSLRETCPIAALSATKLTWHDAGSNTCLCNERPATNHRSRGTDFRCITCSHITFMDSVPTSQRTKPFSVTKTNRLIYFRKKNFLYEENTQHGQYTIFVMLMSVVDAVTTVL